MGFTVEGPRRYAASGHPDPRAGGPSSVGLIRSTDGGRTWRPVSLSGQADLHVLTTAPGGRVYAWDAASGRFLASEDGGRRWRDGALPPVLDLAVDPRDPEHLVASSQDGLLRSRDGGRRWARLRAEVGLSHLEWTGDGLVLLGTDGQVRRLARPADPAPEALGTLPEPPAAATQHDGELLVAHDDGSVLSSRDGGRTWRQRLGPAA